MAIGSAKWLGLSYFTYFFCYGIYLPFWGVWLKGVGLNAEQIGLLLGCGMVARFVGSLFIASQVKKSRTTDYGITPAGPADLLYCGGLLVGQQWMWLLLVMTGFNLFFSPLVPLSDALAATWTQQIGLAYGPVRLWGSLAFVISSALTGMLVSAFSSQAILMLLSVGLVSMLAGMLLTPRTHPQGSERQGRVGGGWQAWRDLIKETRSGAFMVCVTLLQGAHAAYYGFSAIWWQESGYSASVVGYLWSLGV